MNWLRSQKFFTEKWCYMVQCTATHNSWGSDEVGPVCFPVLHEPTHFNWLSQSSGTPIVMIFLIMVIPNDNCQEENHIIIKCIILGHSLTTIMLIDLPT